VHSSLRQLDRTRYQRLLAHACQAPDFAYLGSEGNEAARGQLSGFSALAIEQSECPAERSPLDTRELAERMENLRRQYALPGDIKPLFPGGWLGVMGYEFGYRRERRLVNLTPDCPFPVIHAGFYLWTASHDRTTDDYWLWVHPQCPSPVRKTLEAWLSADATPQHDRWQMPSPFAPEQTPEAFRAGVGRVKDYILAGDCYQANLSQAFTGTFTGDPWCAFRALTAQNPTPYSAFIRMGGRAVISVSPERFLDIRHRTVITSPIKGTRPRGQTPEEDAQLAAELQASEKDRAENLMIVDLLRNDLGLHARTGSVAVDRLFALESYRNVHHLVSHIRCTLRDDVTPLQALFDAFPGGSITGAPKIRAMEIIRELEPHWRGPYCGSVFYYGLDGHLDSNIAIRTLLCEEDGSIHCWGGGGIVTDSDPEAEYQETLAKVQPLMRFLETPSSTRK